MLQLNNYKLISPTTWGEILGQLTDQEDLMSLLQNDTDGLKEWVESKKYLTEHQDLSAYALKTEIPSLDGYATQAWVNGRLKEIDEIDIMADNILA